MSIQVQKLEQELGIAIFDRSTSPISPTVDGQRFIERAQEIVTSVQRLENFTEELSDDYDGLLRVGIIPTLAPFLIPLFTEDLQKDHPNFRLDFNEVKTEKVISGIKTGQFDVGVISTPYDGFGINTTPLFYERFLIYSNENQYSSQNSIDLDDIKYDSLWLLDEGNCFRDQVNNFCDLTKIRAEKHFVYRSSSIYALMRIVDTKGGTTILPELSTLSLTEEQEENVKEIAGTPKVREIGLITRTNFDKRRFIEKLEEYILKNIPSKMLNQQGATVVDPEIDSH